MPENVAFPKMVRILRKLFQRHKSCSNHRQPCLHIFCFSREMTMSSHQETLQAGWSSWGSPGAKTIPWRVFVLLSYPQGIHLSPKKYADANHSPTYTYEATSFVLLTAKGGSRCIHSIIEDPFFLHSAYFHHQLATMGTTTSWRHHSRISPPATLAA